jgi:aspartate kinase
VLQNVSHMRTGKTDVTFTLPVKDGPRAVEALGAVQAEVGHEEVLYDEHVGKVTLVGAGMRSHPGVTATFCECLAEAGVNIEMMNTSEIRISALIRDLQLDDAVRALHAAFELGGDEQAVVHAGTGR